MKCFECGGNYIEQQGPLSLFDESIGHYRVDGVSYYTCNKCGHKMYPVETSEAIDKKRNEIRDELVKKEPIGSFISAADTAKILGISRQALHKHRRIRRGFIYSTIIGGITLYHKESVQFFKRFGDGRIPLYRSGITPISVQYTQSSKSVHMREWPVKSVFEVSHKLKWSITEERKPISPKGVSYARRK